MVNFKFAKFHCHQQIQSFLITPYFVIYDSSSRLIPVGCTALTLTSKFTHKQYSTYIKSDKNNFYFNPKWF
jgi:uncharacterized CHY-type Zn-finger protein